MAWQPIETAPKDGTLVDLWADGERLPDCFWFAPEWSDEEEHCWRQKYAETVGCSFAVMVAPSHWMPQPQPPG